MLPNDVRNTLEAYFAHYPQDAARLRCLTDLLDSGEVDVTARSSRVHVTASAVVINDHGQILLVHHVPSGTWMPPSEHPETSDRSLADTAGRSGAEMKPKKARLSLIYPDPIEVRAPSERCSGSQVRHADFRFLFRSTSGVTIDQVHPEPGGVDWLPPTMLPGTLRNRVLSLGYDAATGNPIRRTVYRRALSAAEQQDAVSIYNDGNGPSVRELADKFDVAFGTMHRVLRRGGRMGVRGGSYKDRRRQNG